MLNKNKLLKEKIDRMDIKIHRQEKHIKNQEIILNNFIKVINTKRYHPKHSDESSHSGGNSHSVELKINGNSSPSPSSINYKDKDSVKLYSQPLIDDSLLVVELPPEKENTSISKFSANNTKTIHAINTVNKNAQKDINNSNLESSTPNNDGFTLVESRKKKGPVYGTKVNSPKGIAGIPTPRTMEVFIGGIDPDVSTD